MKPLTFLFGILIAATAVYGNFDTPYRSPAVFVEPVPVYQYQHHPGHAKTHETHHEKVPIVQTNVHLSPSRLTESSYKKTSNVGPSHDNGRFKGGYTTSHVVVPIHTAEKSIVHEPIVTEKRSGGSYHHVPAHTGEKSIVHEPVVTEKRSGSYHRVPSYTGYQSQHGPAITSTQVQVETSYKAPSHTGYGSVQYRPAQTPVRFVHHAPALSGYRSIQTPVQTYRSVVHEPVHTSYRSIHVPIQTSYRSIHVPVQTSYRSIPSYGSVKTPVQTKQKSIFLA